MEIGLLIGIFVVSLILGVPIFIVLGLVSMAWLLFSDQDLLMMAQTMYTSTDQYPIIAIIGFALAGSLMQRGRLSEDLIQLARDLVGHVRGGLAMASQLACMMFAALSGSSPATAAAVGYTMIPAMDGEKYDKAFAGAVVASAGTLGILIPPSNPLIFYGIITNESITKLFFAGIIPGIILGGLLLVVSYLISRKRGYGGERGRERRILFSVWKAKWSLLLPVIMLGGIYAGIFTPVEAAVVGVFYAFFVALLIYRLKWNDLLRSFEDTALLAGTVSIVISTSTIFGRLLTVEGLPALVANAIASVTTTPVFIILMISGFFLVTGMFFETIANIIIFVPIFMPLLKQADVNLIHFGIVLIVVSELGLLTPPVALNVFVTSRLAEVRFEDVCRECLPYFISFFVAILLFVFCPKLVLFFQ